jgi:hypothetical protein
MNRVGPRLFCARTLALAALLAAGSAQADPLRCAGTSISEGDAKLWLLRACGQPTLSDAYCARPQPALAAPALPQPYLQPQPCLLVEEWLYDRGPGNLVAVVRIREGKVISILYGEQGRSAPR